MNELLNQYSGWISIISIFLSIPMGFLINLLTPKIKRWLDSNSEKSIQEQIRLLQEQVDQTDRLVKEPSYAVAKFVNIALRAILGIFAVFGLGIVILWYLLSQIINNPELAIPISTPGQLFSGLVGTLMGAFISFLLSGNVLKLYSMTHRVEKYNEWRKETIEEIDNLKRKRLKNIKFFRIARISRK